MAQLVLREQITNPRLLPNLTVYRDSDGDLCLRTAKGFLVLQYVDGSIGDGREMSFDGRFMAGVSVKKNHGLLEIST